ncbi:MAG: cyclodeaminase/cyclohydrolase family protein [Treponematales bacterium]
MTGRASGGGGLAALSLADFTEALASKAPVPGGGGASALAGALAAALGGMVCALTAGKKKYAAVENAVRALSAKTDSLRREFLALAEEDARVFAPLAEAYAMPADTEAEKAAKRRVMEERLDAACAVPLAVMEKCGETIAALREIAKKGAAIAQSDAGTGAALCKAALQGAALNVFINTKAMSSRERADALNARARALAGAHAREADAVYAAVAAALEPAGRVSARSAGRG